VICATCGATHGATDDDTAKVAWRREFAFGPRRLDGRLYVHGTAQVCAGIALIGRTAGCASYTSTMAKIAGFGDSSPFYGWGFSLAHGYEKLQ
jgi:hypothetical protein